uniref:Uncharacterized protein n=1 Tax=Opuntia streptacantha TaxID=393608 RepID=A0A7C9DKU0_OPUST
MNLVSPLNQIHSPFKGKSKQQPSHKRMENEGSQKNQNKPGRGTATTAVAATTARGGHHGPAMVPTGRGAVLRPSYDAFCLCSCFAGYLFWAICFGLYGLVCFLSSLGLTSNHILLIKFGSKL